MRRLAMIVSVCCLLAAAAACSDDADGDSGDSGDKQVGDTTEVDKNGAEKQVATTKSCSAEVSTTGAHEDHWKGDAQVRVGGKAVDAPGPRAVYQLTSRKNRVALYSPGKEFKGSVSLSVGGMTYASDPADAESLDIDEYGKSAHAEVTLTSIAGDTVDLVADFTCGESKKK